MGEEGFDAIVIGGGPGGYVAAIRAAQLGLRACVVEREHLGGICLNWGCIPTKALLHTADVVRETRRAAEHGVRFGPLELDLGAVVKQSRDAAGQLAAGVGQLLGKHGVTVVDGDARLDGPGRVRVAPAGGGGERTLRADAVVLATGALPRGLPHVPVGAPGVWTYREAMVPERLPERLLVIGAGAIGVEFASLYATLGSRVTLVELLEQVLPTEDAEIGARMRRALERAGVEVHTGARVDALATGATALEATIAGAADTGGAREASFDRALLAVGVAGSVDGLGLETTRVELDGGFVAIDECFETAEPGVYAIGDVTGAPCLAHRAMHQGVALAELLAGGEPRALDPARVPACTYAHPQVASVGLSEAAARERGREVRIGRFPLAANGRAVAIGDTDGMAKTVFDAASGELLGAHLIGPGVTELIGGYAVAMSCEATEAELIETVFPHPTLSEAMHEAVLDAYARALHR